LKLSNLIQPACLKLINEKQSKIYELVNYLNDKVGTNEMSYDELYEALHEYDADIYDKDTVEKIFNQVRAQFGNRTKIAVAHIYTYSHAASIDQKATNFFTNQFDFPSSIRNDFYRSIDQIFHLIEAVDKKHVISITSAPFTLMLRQTTCNMLSTQLPGKYSTNSINQINS
jgi:hypothetical protein